MNNYYKYLFQYLDKEDIGINKSEFQFQLQSHPDYTSILAISDTLSFFNINNGVLSVETSEIEFLPNYFVALLEKRNSDPQFYLVEKKGDVYYCIEDKNKTIISKQELELRWKNTVLLVEKSETDNPVEINKSIWFWTLPSLCIVLYFIMIVKFPVSIETKLFFVFPITGALFSVVALKDLFGTKSELLNRFCNVTASTSCSSVVGSKKWKIFETVNFSDLSMVFFCSQFFTLLLFLFMTDLTNYFGIQKTLLFCSLPVIFTSVYYQKFVEKKWCPICLVIIVIILLELGYILFLLQSSLDLKIYPLIAFGFVMGTITLGWFTLKKLLWQQKELKDFQIKGNRFMRNYEIFKNNLLTSDPIKNTPLQPEETILLGNSRASLEIIIVTSPLCGFCAEAHSVMTEIINKYSEKVCFDIRFNFNELLNSDQKSKKIHQQLVSIYLNHGQDSFMRTLHNWFENKDEKQLNISEKLEIDESKLNLILKKQLNWNELNQINYTPAIIINGYFLPKQYDKKDLIHFINDLSEDEDFQTTL